jgi:hypothetical protein
MRPAGSRDIWLTERPLVSGFEYSKVVYGRIVPLLKGCRVGAFHETFRNQEAGRTEVIIYMFASVRYQCIAMSPVGCRFWGQPMIESRACTKRSWSKTEALRQPDFSRACCDVTVMCWIPVPRCPQIPRTPVLACAAVPDPIEAVAPASQVLRLDPVSLGVPARAVGSPPSRAGLRPERLLRNPVRPRYWMNRTPSLWLA